MPRGTKRIYDEVNKNRKDKRRQATRENGRVGGETFAAAQLAAFHESGN